MFPLFARRVLAILVISAIHFSIFSANPDSLAFANGLMITSTTSIDSIAADSAVASGTVHIGYAPTGKLKFVPLLSIADGLTLAGDSLLCGGGITICVGSENIPFSDSALTLSFKDLASGGADLKGDSIDVYGMNFFASSLTLSNAASSGPEVKMQGAMTIDAVPNLSLGVGTESGSSNFVIVDKSGIELTGVDASLTDTFSVGGFTMVAQLNVSKSGEGDSTKVAIYGTGNISYTESDSSVDNATLYLGSSPESPGILIANRKVAEVAFGISGTWKILGATLVTDSLGFVFYPDINIFKAYGQTAFVVDSISIDVSLGDSSQPGLTMQDTTVLEANLTVSTTKTFTIHGLEFSPTNLTITYDKDSSSYSVTGTADVNYGKESMEIDLGSATTSGIVFKNEKLEGIDAEVTADFSYRGVAFKADSLGLEYNAEKDYYLVSGGAGLKFKSDSVAVAFGDSTGQGLVIQNGKVTDFEVSVTGDLVWGAFTLTAEDLSIKKDSSDAKKLQFSGGLKIEDVFSASLILGQDGMYYNNGHLHVDSLAFMLTDANLGAFTLDTLQITLTDSADTVSVYSYLRLIFPQGWSVGGGLDFDGTALSGFSLFYSDSTGGIPIGDTDLFLYLLDASVQNINDLSNLIVSGTLGVQAGEGPFADAMVSGSGSFTASPQALDLKATCEFEGGWGAMGSLDIDLNWYEGQYSISVDAGMYDCGNSITDCAFQMAADLDINRGGNVFASGDAEVVVPRQVPVIGGMELGEIAFALQHIKSDKSQDYFAAWTEINLGLTKPELGVKFTPDPFKLSLIGSKQIDNIKSSEPSKGKGNTWKITVPDTSATHLMIHLSTSTPIIGAVFSLTIPGVKTPLTGQDLTNNKNGVWLEENLSGDTMVTIFVVNPDSSNGESNFIAGGIYTLEMTEILLGDNPYFSATYGLPKPTLSLQSASISQTSGTVNYTAGSLVPGESTLLVYADSDDKGYDGVLVGGLYPKDSAQLSGSISFDLSGFYPEKYYLYGVVHNGTNSPVKSKYLKSPVSPDPSLSIYLNNQCSSNSGVSGWQATVSGKGIQDTLLSTGYQGWVSYPDLKNGTYTVALQLQNGFKPCGDTTFSVQVKNKKSDPTRFSIYQENASISGVVFDDVNGNGVQDAGESGFTGIQVTYLSGSDTLQTSSGAAGYYSIQPSCGWSKGSDPCTKSGNGSCNHKFTLSLSSDSLYFSTADSTYQARIKSPCDNLSYSFAMRKYNQISGKVSGAKGKSSKRKYTINLLDLQGKVLQSATSDKKGDYKFSQVPAGNFYVGIKLSKGETLQSPSSPYAAATILGGKGAFYASIGAGDFAGNGFQDLFLMEIDGKLSSNSPISDLSIISKVTEPSSSLKPESILSFSLPDLVFPPASIQVVEGESQLLLSYFSKNKSTEIKLITKKGSKYTNHDFFSSTDTLTLAGQKIGPGNQPAFAVLDSQNMQGNPQVLLYENWLDINLKNPSKGQYQGYGAWNLPFALPGLKQLWLPAAGDSPYIASENPKLALTAAELNSDLSLDAVMLQANAKNQLYAYPMYQFPSGFVNKTSLYMGKSAQAPIDVIAADFNGDGLTDIAGGESQIIIYFNSETGFNTTDSMMVPGSFSGGLNLHPGDIDGDGDIDLIEMGSGTLLVNTYLANTDSVGFASLSFSNEKFIQGILLPGTNGVVAGITSSGHAYLMRFQEMAYQGQYLMKVEGGEVYLGNDFEISD